MNPLYEKIAKAIRTNTLRNRFDTVEVIDKEGLVEALSSHFERTDSLFNADKFTVECNYKEGQ